MRALSNHIAIVSHYYPPHVGGLEIVAQQQAKSFVKAGSTVSVVTCAAHQSPPGVVDEEGVIVHRVPVINFFDEHFGIPFPIGGAALIVRLFQEIARADVVYLHDTFYFPSWITYVAARYFKKPIILTQHVGIVKHPSRIITLIQQAVYATWGTLIFKFSQTIIVYNGNVRLFLIEEHVDPRKILELRNGIDHSIFSPPHREEKNELRRHFNLPLGKPLGLFVGRFVPKKGFTTLLEAHDPDYDLVFAGSGAILERWHSIPGVHILGPLTQGELAKLYKTADMFVFPAEGEIFTLAMQEAMASGLPVITTDEPGYRTYDIDRNLIAFIEPTVSALKRSMKRLVADSALCKKMSAYSVDLAKQRFDWDTNIKTVLDLGHGTRRRRGRVVVTTSWDDGHILDMKLAELLSRYGIPGTFYIAPGNRQIKKEDRLTKECVRYLSGRNRFEIGAHTMTHPLLSRTSDESAEREITDSKTLLEEWTGQAITSFCYPSGDYQPHHVRMVEDAGFSLARTITRFSSDVGSDPFELPTTIHAYRHWSDAAPIFIEGGAGRFLQYYLHWDDLAIALFDKIYTRGGVFHLWGHSWEVEKNGDWRRLERVLDYISNRTDVDYVTNKELF